MLQIFPRSRIQDDKGVMPPEWTAYLQSLVSTVDNSYQVIVPVNGFSITISNDLHTLLLDPAGTLATGSITMPSQAVDGQIVKINSTQTITALTVSANATQSIKNAPTALSVSTTGAQGYTFIFVRSNATWYRVQ